MLVTKSKFTRAPLELSGHRLSLKSSSPWVSLGCHVRHRDALWLLQSSPDIWLQVVKSQGGASRSIERITRRSPIASEAFPRCSSFNLLHVLLHWWVAGCQYQVTSMATSYHIVYRNGHSGYKIIIFVPLGRSPEVLGRFTEKESDLFRLCLGSRQGWSRRQPWEVCMARTKGR